MTATSDVSLILKPGNEAIATHTTAETVPTSKIWCVYAHAIYVMLCDRPDPSLVCQSLHQDLGTGLPSPKCTTLEMGVASNFSSEVEEVIFLKL